MKYQKWKFRKPSHLGWALAILYLFETGPIDRYCCWPVFPFYPAAAILSHARPGNITTADPHAAIVSFFFFPFLFSSHRQPTNEIVVGVTFSSLCVRIVLSLAHAWAIGLLFSPAGQHATRMYEQSHGSLVWVRVVCALNYGRGKNFRRQHVFAWQTFSLSLSFSPFWLLHFLSPSCELRCANWQQVERHIECVSVKKPRLKWISKTAGETGRALKWDDESISSFLIIAFMPSQTATATFFIHV